MDGREELGIMIAWRMLIVAVAAVVATGCSRRADVGGSSASASVAATSAATNAAPRLASAVAAERAGESFGAPCVVADECAGGVCFHKRIKGPDSGAERRGDRGEAVEHDGYCSMRCDDDSECPVPPTKGKCGARGMCKRPD